MDSYNSRKYQSVKLAVFHTETQKMVVVFAKKYQKVNF